MVKLEIRTPKARRTHRRPPVVGYRWRGDNEFEILACGHERPVELGYEPTWWDDDDPEDDELHTTYLAESPSRRACRECPVPKGWDRA